MSERIETLLGKMTLEEKVSLCDGIDFWHTAAIKRLDIPSLKMTDGPYGCRTVDDDGQIISATCFPTGSGLAATWDTELVNRVGAAIGEEAVARGCSLLLGPCVNIQRSPLAGRNFESYSEDPHLSAGMAVAFIKGVQSRGVGTCVKHYALNNSEFQRFTISSEASERTIREIYLPSFEAAVTEAKSWTVMSSYNRVNGTYASDSYFLLTEVLKKEWGFEGAVVSDWGGTYSTVPAANAGLDVEMPGPARFFGESLLKAVAEGQVTEETINDKVRRILGVLERAGLFEKPHTPAATFADNPDVRALARQAAGESIVLLKNKGGVLPLNKARLKTLAVIGHNAVEARIEGSGSSRVRANYVVTPLEALKKYCGDSVRIVFEMGYRNNRVTPPLKLGDFVGEYFTSDDLSGEPFARRTENELSFVFTSAGSAPGLIIGRDTRSARWKAEFVAQESGRYTFGVATDGLARVSVDGNVVYERLIREGRDRENPVEKTVAVDMTAGQTYQLMVEYRAAPRQRTILRRFRFGCEPPAPQDMVERAVKAAEQADAVLVFAGTNDEWESEGFDRENLELPCGQAGLIEKIATVNRKTIVVLNTGAPVDTVPWSEKAAALLEAWFAGQECGNAIVDVLFGSVNPSGRLPVTFPVRLEDTPAFINYPGEGGRVFYGEGVFVGYRYYDMKRVEPAFAFGHGLSYTTFRYGNLKINTEHWQADDTVGVTLDVTNTGRRAGKEVVQLYIRDMKASVLRPPAELKGFRKVGLNPGETKTVDLHLDRRSFSFYDVEKKQWVAEPGEFEILVGSSSRDIRLKGTFDLK